MTDEEIKILNDRLDEHCIYQSDTRKLMLREIDNSVDDFEQRKLIFKDCHKEFSLAYNLIDFARNNLEQFVEFCKNNTKLMFT